MTGTSANTIAWTNADILEASANGTANFKDLTVDFSNVNFGAPGVYRYKITETANEYTTSGVTDGSISNVRFLDVYVKRSDNYDPAELTAEDWDVYGYVCVDDGTEDITPDSEDKTNGFVDPDPADDSNTADQYRTYNLTLSKELTGDTTMRDHQFPFDVAYTAGAATGTFQFIAEKTGEATVATTTEASTTKTVNGNAVSGSILKVGGADGVATAQKDGDPKIAHEATVKYIGIPNGTKVTVTETNDVSGTTYTTTATEKVGSGSAAAVAFDGASTGTLSTDKKTATVNETKTAVYAQATAPTNDTNVEIAYKNAFSIISPTGVIVRYAPYIIMAVAAGVLTVVALKSSKRKAEEA